MKPTEHPATIIRRDAGSLREARIADCHKWIGIFDQMGATGLVALYRKALAAELAR